MEQQLLFPELDPYLTKIKNIDYVDLSDVKCGESKKTPYSILPKDHFILFKSGGFNKYHPEMGNAFPYIQNKKTLKVLNVTSTEYNGYIKSAINFRSFRRSGENKSLFIQMHRVVAEAFIENDMPDKKILVDHINGDSLDYRVENLRWVTHRENNIGVKRPRQLSFIEKARMEKLKKWEQ